MLFVPRAQHPTTAVVLWPRATEMEDLLNHTMSIVKNRLGRILSDQLISVDAAQLRSMAISLYGHQNWLNDKISELQTNTKTPMTVRVLLVKTQKNQDFLEVKHDLRRSYGIGKSSIHITDNPTEAQAVLKFADNLSSSTNITKEKCKEGDDWCLIDVGNGRPYFTPLWLRNNESAHHSYLHYRLRSLAKNGVELFAMEHKRDGCDNWKENYRFCAAVPSKDIDVDAIVHAHTTDPNFGHMLHSLRLNRWSLCDTTSTYEVGQSVVLKDDEAYIYHTDGSMMQQFAIESGKTLAVFVKKHFGCAFLGCLDDAAPIILQNLETMKNKNKSLVKLLKKYMAFQSEGEGGCTLGDRWLAQS